MTTAKKAVAPKPVAGVADEGNLGGHVVVGSRVQVTVGSQVLQFSYGDALPKGVSEESLERLLNRGLIKKN